MTRSQRTRGVAGHAAAGVVILLCCLVPSFAETVSYRYDAVGRLTTAVYEADGTNAAIHYVYDADGTRTNVVSVARGDHSYDSDGDAWGDLDELVHIGDLTLTPDGDVDADRLANVDEIAFGSDVFLADSDGDGADDYHEWVSDTDPNCVTSRFVIVGIVRSNVPPSVVVTFSSRPTRHYTLRKRTGSLIDGAWSNVTGQVNIPGVGPEDILSDTNPPAMGFYQIGVSRP